MDNIIRPETVFAKKFETAFIAGERSDIAIHKALIEGLVDFVKTDFNTTGLAWAVRFMQARNPESARFNAIVKYLRTVANLRVILNDEDYRKTNVKTVKKASYDKAWLAECKSTPWYKVARSMQVAKPWEDRLDKDVNHYALGFIMGDVDREGLLDIFAPKVVDQIVRTALSDDKVQKKAADLLDKLLKQELKEAA